jgi:hypothetical protein
VAASSGLAFLAGFWMLAVTNCFWTAEDHRFSLPGAHYGMEIGSALVRRGAWLYQRAAFSNLGYALIQKRRI